MRVSILAKSLAALAASALACRLEPSAVPPAAADVGSGAVSPQEAIAEAAREPELAPRIELPPGWESLTDLAFERRLDEWLPAGERRSLSEGALDDLNRALEGGDTTALRAAAMLGRTLDPLAGEILLARLEQRLPPPEGEPGRDAADVVAAAAFGAGMSAREAAARLNRLAVGRRSHPSLAVRVECGRSAIALGRDEPIPYLLEVLREGTHAGRPSGPGVREDDLAWAQVRAAEALAARAGTASRFLPEASVKECEDEAARLESLLPPPPKRR